MGWNTTILVLNDFLHDIENDPKLHEKLASMVTYAPVSATRQLQGPHHMKVIATHDADDWSLQLVGGNMGLVLTHIPNHVVCTDEGINVVAALRECADLMGYRLVKKS